MARPRIIENEPQIVEWIKEDRPYRKIVELYELAYRRQLSKSTINNVRKRNGLPSRIHRDQALMPWSVSPEHRNQTDAVCLRAEGRNRAGLELNEQTEKLWRRWRAELIESDLVIHYDSAEGWTRVPRQPGDEDFIRVPSRIDSRIGYGD